MGSGSREPLAAAKDWLIRQMAGQGHPVIALQAAGPGKGMISRRLGPENDMVSHLDCNRPYRGHESISYPCSYHFPGRDERLILFYYHPGVCRMSPNLSNQ